MIDAGATSTEEVVAAPYCARPTGGSHALTTGDSAQRGEGAMRRPRQGGSSAANNMGIIKARAP
jgi:hypothetical protein